MERTRSQWIKVVKVRLGEVHEGVIRGDHPVTIIRELRSFGTVSEYYDGNCLAVDVWHIFDRRPVYVHRRFTEAKVIRDPLVRVFFGIVVQSIYDVKLGRPCDSHAWRTDYPPGDGSRCTPAMHLCKKNAVEFLVENANVWESVLNLSYGTLVDIIQKENGSLQSRSQEIFNYIGQGS